QLIHGYHASGERQRAADCYARLLPFSGQLQCFVVDRALGIAAACRGDIDVARTHLQAAVALGERADLLPELALSLVQLGALENNDRGPIARGLRIAADLGMTRLAEATLQRGIDSPARAA